MAAEDALGELYAWDSTIEDDFALPAGDPKRDEDKTEDAFEQIIHAASSDAGDVVLSLAAQLLHKHFFRFPHVQINVVDVLLKLCGPKRSQAVRIHTLRALLQIAKTPAAAAAASTPTSAAAIARKNTRMWLQRIDESVQHMLDTEKSSVILRQVTTLRLALEERLVAEPAADAGDEQSAPASPSERSRKKPRDEDDAADADGYAQSERDPKKAKRDDDAKPPAENSNIIKLTREPSDKQLPPNGRVVEGEAPRRRTVNAFSPRNCPPCPYLFLGSVPRHTPSDDIVDFLSPVWPEINKMSVQIKQPDHNATAYAFVSMPTIEHAREAIHFVNANKFRGRAFLNANFARGPPVDTVLFVERTGEDVSMEDKGAVRDFDFTKCDPEVWDVLCQQLERFGPLSFAENGCVRFRSVEHAKAAIRKQLFTVKGYEIFPVYDTKEQFAIDSTRHGGIPHNKLGFALKSGRLVGGDADYRGSKHRHYKDNDDPMDGRPMYRQELPPPQRRSPSPLPPPSHHRSSSPPPQGRRRSPSPPSQQQRESYERGQRGEFAPRGRDSGYSPPPSPLLQNYGPGPTGPSDRHEFEPEIDDRSGREPSRHERRHHSRRDRSRDDKAHRSHRDRDRREKRSSRPERSLTPSPVRRDHASSSTGRKSNGPSPRRSFSRRNDGDNQTEEAPGKDKQTRSKTENDSEPQQKETKNGGTRMARDELFAGMDDLTVDYEEDDE
ncbi:RNA recognition motif domain [Phytophthora cinnamomi]|uniref:RNA recognition motif domain n=1 Tax=Phytophthora cinnamomi TaxID=4785 RepID=UPI00355AC74B|nr:RNA recognition motif domain [Phytophthora cinnamomi]